MPTRWFMVPIFATLSLVASHLLLPLSGEAPRADMQAAAQSAPRT